MKIQLDTTNKTIKVEESVNLQELTDALEKLLPNEEWKKFKLETNTVIKNWSAPIIIRERVWPYWNNSPWNPLTTLCNDSTAGLHYQGDNHTLRKGVYNIEA